MTNPNDECRTKPEIRMHTRHNVRRLAGLDLALSVSVQIVAGRANLSSSSPSSFWSSEMGQSTARTRRRTMTIGLRLRCARL